MATPLPNGVPNFVREAVLLILGVTLLVYEALNPPADALIVAAAVGCLAGIPFSVGDRLLARGVDDGDADSRPSRKRR